MKVQILEKIYHSSQNTVNIRRLREFHWIKELGTVAPYGCNDQIIKKIIKDGQSLQKIIKDGQSLLYKHFRLPGHSVADMKVQILEKIYHSSENTVNTRRLRELHWIKELGTAAPYGCNDQIKGVGTLSSPSCKHTNVLSILNKQQKRKRSHGHWHYNRKTPQLDSSIDTFINLIYSINQPQGVHKIKTTLFLTMNLLSIELQF